MTRTHPDSQLIESLGGAAAVARLLKFDRYGTQRVHNWIKRGIPAAVRLEHEAIFALSRRAIAGQAGEGGRGS